MKNNTNKFSIKARKNSIQFALQGMISFFRCEHNARIHLVATIFVIALGIISRINWFEAAILTLATGFVWIAEIFNTAIESMMDHLSPEKHENVRIIKDVSAAAVLFSAFVAVIVGAFIFLPKLI
jgi:diacylglycerol kinase (ATP)